MKRIRSPSSGQPSSTLEGGKHSRLVKLLSFLCSHWRITFFSSSSSESAGYLSKDQTGENLQMQGQDCWLGTSAVPIGIRRSPPPPSSVRNCVANSQEEATLPRFVTNFSPPASASSICPTYRQITHTSTVPSPHTLSNRSWIQVGFSSSATNTSTIIHSVQRTSISAIIEATVMVPSVEWNSCNYLKIIKNMVKDFTDVVSPIQNTY